MDFARLVLKAHSLKFKDLVKVEASAGQKPNRYQFKSYDNLPGTRVVSILVGRGVQFLATWVGRGGILDDDLFSFNMSAQIKVMIFATRNIL